MNNSIKYLLVLVIGLVYCSCKKDDPVAQVGERAELLSEKVWKYQDIIKNGNPYFKTCDMDDRFHYFLNGTYRGENGTQECDSNINNILEGTWQLANNDTELHLSYKVYANLIVRPIAKILILNTDTLKVDVDLPLPSGSDNFVITYIHD